MDERVKVHCITNPVTMQDMANVILAAGGTAIMAQDPAEAEEITGISNVTLINTGVPDDVRWRAALLAGRQANRLHHPAVLDPVGAGASEYRRQHLKELLEKVKFSLIRCNQEEAAVLSEILSGGESLGQEDVLLYDRAADERGASGGVDSALCLKSDQRRQLAVTLAKRCGCCVYVSGEADVVSDGKRTCEIFGGDSRMTKITGSGCMLSALCAVFAGEETDIFASACRAGRLWRECARVSGKAPAEKKRQTAAGGLGSFHVRLLDALDLARNWRSAGISPKQLRVYAVSSENWLRPGEDLTDPVRELLAAGVSCLQLREKEGSDEEILRKAKDLKELCHLYTVPLIINDRPDLALAAGADGVHVGLSDMGVEKARRLLGKKFVIGASAHNVSEALAAQKAGADYIGCGAVFGSKTKKNVSELSIEELSRICRAVEIPVVAIGGISAGNMKLLKKSGISGVAVVSALFQAKDKEKEVKKFLEQSRVAYKEET